MVWCIIGIGYFVIEDEEGYQDTIKELRLKLEGEEVKYNDLLVLNTYGFCTLQAKGM